MVKYYYSLNYEHYSLLPRTSVERREGNFSCNFKDNQVQKCFILELNNISILFTVGQIAERLKIRPACSDVWRASDSGSYPTEATRVGRTFSQRCVGLLPACCCAFLRLHLWGLCLPSHVWSKPEKLEVWSLTNDCLPLNYIAILDFGHAVLFFRHKFTS